MSNLPLGQQTDELPANDAGFTQLMAIKPGERLREARMAQGLSLEEVADNLHLSVSYLKALEADRYSALPGATFVKGYIRGYARILGLPANDLIQAYEQQMAPVPAQPQDAASKPAPQPSQGWLRWVLLAIVLVTAGLSWWYFSLPDAEIAAQQQAGTDSTRLNTEQTSSENSHKALTVSNAEAQQTPVAEPERRIDVVLPEHQTEPSRSVLGSLFSAEPTAAGQPEKAELAESQDKPAVAVITPGQASLAPMVETSPAVVEEPASTNAVSGTGELAIIFTADCWVEIRDAANEQVHAGLHQAGTYFSYNIAKPFKVKLGDGKAVKLSYNGVQLPVNTSGRSNVARVSVRI